MDDPPAYPPLADRDALLAELNSLIGGAWTSFDRPREEEPGLGADLEVRLGEPLPEAGSDPSAALADAARVLDESISPARPLYLGYVGSTGLEVGVLGAALAATYDVNLAATARTADLVEAQALRWVGELIGFPFLEGAFTSGGMTSNLTALLVARESALPGARVNGFDGTHAAVYCSDEAHHSVVRAAESIGLGSQQVRRLPIDSDRRVDPADVASAIAADRAAGITPVAVIANGGTTLTGAVDPLAGLAEVCERERVWLHVDGAYGLPAAATERARPLFEGLERADSVTLDAHKWLGIQKGCSVMLSRHAGSLEASFGHEEAYIQRTEKVNAVERTLEYSRPLNSLKLWLALRTHGAAEFRRWIEHTLHLAALLVDAVRADPEFELLHEPQLSTVCFRHAPGGVADLDAHNAALAARAQEDGRVFLADAVVDGRRCLRVCFVNFRTRATDVPFILETLRDLGGAPAAGRAAAG
jgi:aromatic-L-amino-acid/L-tryptophan decarboxylase